MTTQFLKAAVPEPFIVLGLRLRPLSIGHLVLMQWSGLSFMREDNSKPNLDDLIIGCLICSMRFRQYQEFLQSPDIASVLTRLGRRALFEPKRGWSRLAFWRKAKPALRVQERFELFDKYLADGMDIPQFELPNSAAQSMIIGSPWLQCLRIMLMTKFHMPAEETWDYPYRQAVWDVCTARESDGALSIIGENSSPEHDAAVAAMEELNDEIRKALGMEVRN